MNKKQTTMLVSIAAVTVVVSMLLVSGTFGRAIGIGGSGSSNGPDYTTAPQGVYNKDLDGQVTKIYVEIDSPYGFERVTSFKLFQTDNLMKKGGYYTLRLFGPIMGDKITLLHWIAKDLGNLPDGLYIEMPITTGGNKPAKMTKPKEGAKIDVIPMTGKITLYLLENNQDAMYTSGNTAIRKLEFSGCHVAGYTLGTNYDDEKQYFRDGIQHFEEVDFGCTQIRDLKSQGADNNRGFMVETAINNDNRQITNEKGELITKSREYRQPIVLEGKRNVEEPNHVKQEIVTRTALDKTYYKVGDKATFTITFTDLEGSNIEPDKIKALYDGKMIQLEQQDGGIYTFTTPGLTKEHHQIIVSVDKSGFPTDTTYLSIPIHRIS